MAFSPKKLAVSSLTSLLLAGSLLTTVQAPASAEEELRQNFVPYTAQGQTSYYHLYAENIDWDQPVGVVFYLDGDYFTTSQSKVYNPSNSQLLGMAQVASEHNMLFVPVISPDKDAETRGITWHEDLNGNGDWFRSFANDFMDKYGIDRTNVWTVGHSGGAEITGFELGADRQDSWRDGGGSIMVGGGNTNGMQTLPSQAAQSNLSFHWYVGNLDGKDAAGTPNWSAYNAAQRGYSIYTAAGYQDTFFTEIPGMDHYRYDFPAILEEALDKVDPLLSGAIGSYYYQNDGAETLGQPQGREYTVEGGSQQLFQDKNGKQLLLVWSEQTGQVTPVAL